MTPTPEFSRVVRFLKIEEAPVVATWTATGEEREKLRARLGLLSLASLSAQIELVEEAPRWYRLSGRVQADFEQTCIRTLEPIAQRLDEPLTVRITTDPDCGPAAEGETELSSGDDYEYEAGDSVDAGELVIQLLSMSIDPYPRKEHPEVRAVPGVEVVWDSPAKPRGPADMADVTTKPFAGLADLLAAKRRDGE